MKRYFCLLLLFCILSSCDKEEVDEQFDSSALIIGQDFGACPCCGGYIIEIDEDDSAYRFESLPEESNIDLNSDSIAVKINWILNRECANIKYINIDKIVKD